MSKKIKFKHVKPGMVVQGSTIYGLIVSIPGKHANGRRRHAGLSRDKNWATYFCAHDAHYGSGSSPYDPNEKVRVIKGKKRAEIITRIQRDLRKFLYNREQDLDLIDLIITLEPLHDKRNSRKRTRTD